MKVDVQELTPVKRAIKVEIPQEVVSKEFSQAYAKLQRRVKVPGFRPGKAPISLLERRYTKEVEEDIVQKLVPDYYRKAIEETGLKPVELPAIEQISVKKDAPLFFTATVEVRPKIVLTNYSGMKLERQAISVREEDVEKALAQLQDQHSQLESCEPGHGIKGGDYVIIDFEGFAGGVSLAESKAEGFLLEVGSKTLTSEIEDALIGRKGGESFEVLVTLPEDHPNRQWAGKEFLFKIKIHEVKRKVLPVLDDDFAKDLGFASMEELRSKLRTEIENRLKSERTAREKEQLVKQLIGQHTFEVPPSMAEREIQDILHRLENHRRLAGSAPQEGTPDLAALQKEYMPIAEGRARGRVLLQAIAEQEKLSVDVQEVEQEIAFMARGMKITVDEIKRLLLSQQGSLEGIRTKLLERKALEFIHSKAIFVEK